MTKQHRIADLDQRAADERSYMQAHGRRTLINSLSGGVDSTVSGAVSARAAGKHALAVMLPCSREPERLADIQDATLVAKHLGLPHTTIQLLELWEQATQLLEAAARDLAASSGVELKPERLAWAKNNLKPTLRMMASGFMADAFDGLMMGTDNAIENFLGYFSIRGDGVADRQPIRDCTKAEVRSLAASAGLPEQVVNRTPTAGLWPGQTDEGELGFSYNQADTLFLWLVDRHLEQPVFDNAMTVLESALERVLVHPGLPVPADVARQIIAVNRRTAFKRKSDDMEKLLQRRGLL